MENVAADPEIGPRHRENTGVEWRRKLRTGRQHRQDDQLPAAGSRPSWIDEIRRRQSGQGDRAQDHRRVHVLPDDDEGNRDHQLVLERKIAPRNGKERREARQRETLRTKIDIRQHDQEPDRHRDCRAERRGRRGPTGRRGCQQGADQAQVVNQSRQPPASCSVDRSEDCLRQPIDRRVRLAGVGKSEPILGRNSVLF